MTNSPLKSTPRESIVVPSTDIRVNCCANILMKGKPLCKGLPLCLGKHNGMKKRIGHNRHKTHFVELRAERELLFISRRKFVPHLKCTLKKTRYICCWERGGFRVFGTRDTKFAFALSLIYLHVYFKNHYAFFSCKK